MTDIYTKVQNNVDILIFIDCKKRVKDQTEIVNNLVKEAIKLKLAIDVEDIDFSYSTDDFYKKNELFLKLHSKQVQIKVQNDELTIHKTELERLEKNTGGKLWMV